ncbi:MAG: phytanoyl-CoA dioxygenase family protein [Candidatus Acidiferrum sp.]
MDWLTRVEREGFGVALDVLPQHDIEVLIDSLGRMNLPRSRAGVRHAMRHLPVAELARGPRLLQMAQEILGNDAFPFRATLFDKSSSANWLVVWHQDTALPLQARNEVEGWGPWSVKEGVVYSHAPAKALSQILALRLHLDDSAECNGPLRVLPGTHTLGVLADDDLHRLSKQVEAVDCLVPRGGLLAMRPLIVHASSKAQAKIPRRVLHIEYSSADADLDGLRLAVA